LGRCRIRRGSRTDVVGNPAVASPLGAGDVELRRHDVGRWAMIPARLRAGC
jgi:hypothetical protein